MSLKKVIYLILGFIGLILGAIGAVLPLLPAFPFLLMAAYFFARSSKRVNDWFLSTKLYKNNLESFVKGKGMTVKTKVKIMVMITLLMLIGFVMMNKIFVGQIVLFIVWVFHILYFIFGIKTISSNA